MQKFAKNFLCLAVWVVAASGCASQYYHPFKKQAEFYDDLGNCEAQADRERLYLKGAAREKAIDECMGHFGWKSKENYCFNRRLESRMPASVPCKK